MRDQIFISYSHKDKKWLSRLQLQLAPLIRSGLDVWDDTRIKAGSSWREEIQIALSRARVGVLLVTPHYLASEFVITEELPHLFDAAAKDGLIIFWIAVSSSTYEVTNIAKFQAVNDPLNPLDKLRRHAEINEELVRICKLIKESFSRTNNTSSDILLSAKSYDANKPIKHTANEQFPSPSIHAQKDSAANVSAEPPAAEPASYEPVPPSAVRLFRWCWQLEHWLRLMVYVEMRANMIDWESVINKFQNGWPSSTYEKDKKLHHMSTAQQTSVSFLNLAELWSTIDSNWLLFEPYFPPRNNVNIRIEEIQAIHNRIMHLRDPHPQDEARLELFLRDIEPGLRRFCMRYTCPKIPRKRDPLSEQMHTIWPDFNYAIELLCADKSWLYASGRYRHRPIMNACIDLLTHQKYQAGSFDGVIYALSFRPVAGKEMDALKVLENTKKLHGEIIHFFMFNTLTVTIPAIYGVERVANIVCEFLDIAKGHSQNNYSSGSAQDITKVRRQEWPEYVLWPSHMLDLFVPEMKEMVLDLS